MKAANDRGLQALVGAAGWQRDGAAARPLHRRRAAVTRLVVAVLLLSLVRVRAGRLLARIVRPLLLMLAPALLMLATRRPLLVRSMREERMVMVAATVMAAFRELGVLTL